MDDDAELLLHYHRSEPKKQDTDPDSKPASSGSSEKQIGQCSAGSSLSEMKKEAPSSSDSQFGDSSYMQHDSNSSTSTLSKNQVVERVHCALPPHVSLRSLGKILQMFGAN
jgi:hypothetical protein